MPSNHRLLNAALYGCLFVFALSLFTPSPSLTSIASAYGVDRAHSGMLFSASFGGYVLAVILGGVLADTVGKRRVIIASCAIFTVGSAVFGLLPALGAPFSVALAVMVVIGGGAAALESMASALLSDVNPDRRAYVLNLSQIFLSFGAILTPAMVAVFLKTRFGWQGAYLTVAGFGAVLLVALLTQRCDEQSSDKFSLEAALGLLRHRLFWALAALLALYVGAEIGFWGWISTYLEKQFAMSPPLAANGVLVFWIGMTGGRVLMAWATSHVSLRRLLIASAVGSAVAIAVAAAMPGGWLTLAASGVVGFLMAGTFALILAEAGQAFPHNSGTLFGMMFAFSGIGGMIFPYLFGVLGVALTGALGESASLRVAMGAPALVLLPFVLIVLLCRLEGAAVAEEQAEARAQ